MTAANLNRFYRYARLFRGLASGALVLSLVYLYLLSSTVFSSAAREQAITTLADRQASLVGLEAEYLDLSAGVTIERATSLGFHDAANATTFVRSRANQVVAVVR